MTEKLPNAPESRHCIPSWCHAGDWFCKSCYKTWPTRAELMADAAEPCPCPPPITDHLKEPRHGSSQ